jgi:hypothetical protein
VSGLSAPWGEFAPRAALAVAAILNPFTAVQHRPQIPERGRVFDLSPGAGGAILGLAHYREPLSQWGNPSLGVARPKLGHSRAIIRCRETRRARCQVNSAPDRQVPISLAVKASFSSTACLPELLKIGTPRSLPRCGPGRLPLAGTFGERQRLRCNVVQHQGGKRCCVKHLSR